MINIYTYVDRAYLSLLYDVVIPRLPAGFPHMNIVLRNDDMGLVGRTNEAAYKEIMLDRQKKYIEILKRHKGEKVVFLDADVVIFKDFTRDLSARLDQHPFWYMDYIHESAAGPCLAFVATEEIIQMWEDFITSCDSIPTNERQDGFPEFELHDFIENRKVGRALPPTYGYLSRNSYCYHATNGGTFLVEKKLILELVCDMHGHLQKASTESLQQKIKEYDRFAKTPYNMLYALGFQGGYPKGSIRPSAGGTLFKNPRPGEVREETNYDIAGVEFLDAPSSTSLELFIESTRRMNVSPLFLGIRPSWFEDKTDIYLYNVETGKIILGSWYS